MATEFIEFIQVKPDVQKDVKVKQLPNRKYEISLFDIMGEPAKQKVVSEREFKAMEREFSDKGIEVILEKTTYIPLNKELRSKVEEFKERVRKRRRMAEEEEKKKTEERKAVIDDDYVDISAPSVAVPSKPEQFTFKDVPEMSIVALAPKADNSELESEIETLKKMNTRSMNSLRNLSSKFTKLSDEQKQSIDEISKKSDDVSNNLSSLTKELVTVINNTNSLSPAEYSSKVDSLIIKIDEAKGDIDSINRNNANLINGMKEQLNSYVQNSNNVLISTSSQLSSAANEMNQTKNQILSTGDRLASASNAIIEVNLRLAQKEKEFDLQRRMIKEQNELITTSSGQIKSNERLLEQIRAEYETEMGFWKKEQQRLITAQKEHRAAIEDLTKKLEVERVQVKPTIETTNQLLVLNKALSDTEKNNEKTMEIYSNIQKKVADLNTQLALNTAAHLKPDDSVIKKIDGLGENFKILQKVNDDQRKLSKDVLSSMSSSNQISENVARNLVDFTSSVNKALIAINSLKEDVQRNTVPFDYTKLKREVVQMIPKVEPQQGIVEIDYSGINNAVSFVVREQTGELKTKLMDLEKTYESFPNIVSEMNKNMLTSLKRQLETMEQSQERNVNSLITMINQRLVAPAKPYIMPIIPSAPSFSYISNYNEEVNKVMGKADLENTRNYKSLAGQKRKVGSGGHGLALVPGREPDPFIDPEYHVKKARTQSARRKEKSVSKERKRVSRRTGSLI